MRTRSAVIAALIAIPLGLATAVAVAWSICLTDPTAPLHCSGAIHPQPCAVLQYDTPTLQTHALLRGLTFDPLTLTPPLANWRGFTFEGGVSWSGSADQHTNFQLYGGDRTVLVRHLSPILPDHADIAAARIAGWPRPCLSSSASRDLAGRWSWSGSIPLHRDPAGGAHIFSRTLPITPRPGPLIFNTFTFAAAWATLLIAPGLARSAFLGLRRRARSRRGQCPECGYDLSATPGLCPECGSQRTKTQSATD